MNPNSEASTQYTLVPSTNRSLCYLLHYNIVPDLSNAISYRQNQLDAAIMELQLEALKEGRLSITQEVEYALLSMRKGLISLAARHPGLVSRLIEPNKFTATEDYQLKPVVS